MLPEFFPKSTKEAGTFGLVPGDQLESYKGEKSETTINVWPWSAKVDEVTRRQCSR